MSEEQWRQHFAGGRIDGLIENWAKEDKIHVNVTRAAAAQILYGKPEGFTRDDVKNLRGLANVYGAGTKILWVEDLADRIEAFLPPDDFEADASR